MPVRGRYIRPIDLASARSVSPIMKRVPAPVFLPLLALSLLMLVGCASGNIEEPGFSLVDRDADFEIRDYAPHLVAGTRVRGDQKEAAGAGFRILADYIFGNNTRREEIPMTAPVSQSPEGEKIAMTAPVSQVRTGDEWIVRFALPAKYTLENVPEPVNDAVELQALPAERMAVLGFPGYARVKRVQEERVRLEGELESRGLEALGPIVLAQYDPPWTLGFLRRNEVMVPVAR